MKESFQDCMLTYLVRREFSWDASEVEAVGRTYRVEEVIELLPEKARSLISRGFIWDYETSCALLGSKPKKCDKVVVCPKAECLKSKLKHSDDFETKPKRRKAKNVDIDIKDQSLIDKADNL